MSNQLNSTKNNTENSMKGTINDIEYVIKRDGRLEEISFDKIKARIKSMCKQLNLDRINPIFVAREVISELCDKMTTEEIDYHTACICANKIIDDTQYNILAAGICISNLHKTTESDFMKVTNILYNNYDSDGKLNPLVSEEYYETVKNNIDLISEVIDDNRDFNFDFFGIKTLERAYLLRSKSVHGLDMQSENKNSDKKQEMTLRKNYGKIIERPQHMIMRVAIGIHGDDMESVVETYNLISGKYLTHASPTLYNAGTPRAQLASCFLLTMMDNIEGIFKTIEDSAFISKWAGGIGIYIGNIRALGSLIRGTNGKSDGILPLARLLNSLARYINQGGRRNGAIAIYLPPWHADVFDFIELRTPQGDEEKKARDMFLGLWISDLFMKRVQEDDIWSLMCPDECPGLSESYGKDFEKLYLKYERSKKYKRQVRAKDLWYKILECQYESGMPYMCFKDNVNHKSNFKHILPVLSSNLCSEIMQPATNDEIAVCNLCSISLSSFVEFDENGTAYYNYEKLIYVAGVCCKNLNKVIDNSYYPVEKAKISNMRHRPMGIGVQGLQDAFYKLNIPFDSEEARIVNKKIFECIYYGALKMSCELAKVNGPYSTFEGSPFSKGILQYHLWGLTEEDLLMDLDWKSLIEDIKLNGTRNSLLTAIMPTASTSQLLGNTECIEPVTANLYKRTTLAGEYIIANKYLVERLIKEDLWNEDIKNEFIYDNGSIKNIEAIPDEIKEVYKTACEMKTKPIIQLSIDRGPFIDQSQSLNIFSNKVNFTMLTSSHFYGWRNGLKTGMYYLRSQPAVDPINFGLDPAIIREIKIKRGELDEDENNEVTSETDEENSDPRRISEIEENHGRRDTYIECEMCSG